VPGHLVGYAAITGRRSPVTTTRLRLDYPKRVPILWLRLKP
jgi:hypothetical protein